MKNTFLVFEAGVETESRVLRASSCPASWRVEVVTHRVATGKPVPTGSETGVTPAAFCVLFVG